MMKRALETTRLRLQPCRIEDVETIHALWTDEGVRRFLFDGRIITPDEARSFVSESLSNFEQFGYGLWLVSARDADCLIGFAGLLRAEGETPNLIYGIHTHFWGEGYATEAARVVLSYTLGKLALPKVKADVDEPNVASVRVLEKLGMKRVNRAVVKGQPLLYFEQARGETAGS